MFETTPPSPGPDARPDAGSDASVVADLADLTDPIASVVAIEVSRSFVRRCLSAAEPMVSELAGQESTLRKPGGVDLAKRLMSQRLYHRMDADVFRLLRECVPLSHAAAALSAIEQVLRECFAEVIGTAASYLLSDDRDAAIQMTAVATTMGGRDVHSMVAEIIAANREGDGEA